MAKEKRHHHVGNTASKNDITGDVLQTKPQTDAYGKGWEKIWGKKPVITEQEADEIQEEQKK